MGGDTFTYFAYGSNLLEKRIHLQNPSAVRRGIGKLKGHRLDFVTYGTRWHGAAATIVPTTGKVVWGAIWEIESIHLDSLDRQEGVKEKIYFVKTVDVLQPSGDIVKCRTYQQTNTPKAYGPEDQIPREQMPSKVYHDVILLGAKESGLPECYISELEKIRNNGYDGPVDVHLSLKE